jgi:hypothetical protein
MIWLTKAKDWALRNKAKVGWAFGTVYLWCVVQGCPPFMGEDLIALAHWGPHHLTCDHLRELVLAISSGLIWGGYVSSDFRVRIEQKKAGIIPPAPGDVPVTGTAPIPLSKP